MHSDGGSADVPISESDLIEIVRRYAEAGYEQVGREIGIGDDAAVLGFDAGRIVLTADAMVDGVHFLSGVMAWRDIGSKCIVSNQSDIAAMGALPEHAVMTLAVPSTMRLRDLEELLSGVTDALQRYGGRLVGGDTVSSDVTMISISMTGRLVDDDRQMTRDVARPGQLVAVSGPLGGSAGGLRMLQGMDHANRGVDDDGVAQLRDAHYRPSPRVDLVPALIESGVNCAMDISDGLILDLERICLASQVDAVIYADKVPQHAALSRIFGTEAQTLSLTGGEDYELLCIADADVIARANARLTDDELERLTVVGEILPQQGVKGEVSVLDASGNRLDFTVKGWDHFAG